MTLAGTVMVMLLGIFAGVYLLGAIADEHDERNDYDTLDHEDHE